MRCTIWIMNDDGTYDGIFCHNYDDNVPKLLASKYGSKEMAKSLILLGHISKLGEKLAPTGEHSFAKPEPGVVVAYSRDNGELKRLYHKYDIKNAEKAVKIVNGPCFCWCPMTGCWHCGLTYKNPIIIERKRS